MIGSLPFEPIVTVLDAPPRSAGEFTAQSIPAASSQAAAAGARRFCPGTAASAHTGGSRSSDGEVR